MLYVKSRYPRVVIVQKSLRQYRVRFYELLRQRLEAVGVELVLIHGEPENREATKGDAAELDWAIKIHDRTFKVGSRAVYWQPCLRQLQGADLVIVEQASKLLLNYVLFLKHLAGWKKLAFWGHGKNLQLHRASRAGEVVKGFMSRRVHWWFAYNDLSADIVHSLGYPQDRITSIQNAIDTGQLVRAREQLANRDIERVRQQLGLRGSNACIFTGGMYRDKRLDYLLEACSIIRAHVPDFEMIFLGAGPEYPRIVQASQQNSWIHAVGPKFDADKVPYFALSKLFLLPGLVGLAVLDAFALEVPLVTTNVSFHSPEIDYLKNGMNGWIVDDTTDPNTYASAVINLLQNDPLRSRLVEGCRSSRTTYSIEVMVERFASGIEAALAH
jgi:glycosyltransferase involved in cell wall biosynthesis